MKIEGTIDICGDTHGNLFPIFNWLEGNTKNLIHVGDFGLTGINYSQTLKNLGQELNQKNKNLFIVRGNHDWPFFNNEFFGGTNGGVHLVKDGTVLNWGEKNILLNGGGISLDRKSRVKGLYYWVEEEFKYLPINHNIKIDHLITHVSFEEVTSVKIHHPFVFKFATNDSGLIRDLHVEQQRVENYVKDLIENGHPLKTWHYGHFHRVIESEYKGIKCRGLAIDEIIPFCRKFFE